MIIDMEVRLFIAGLIILVAAYFFRKSRGKFTTDKAKKVYAEILEWLDTASWALLMAAVIMYLFIQAFKIPSGSMVPTLNIGDHLFVNKCVYGMRVPFTDTKILPLRRIQRKDIVIFRYPAKGKFDMHYGKDFIKRVIGLPGETVEIKNKQVFINGQLLDEPYKKHYDSRTYPGQAVYFNREDYNEAWQKGEFATVPHQAIRDNFGPITVPEGYYFVLGDNRDQSFDGRFWGPLDIKRIKGKALVVYWPLTKIRLIR